MNWRHCLRAGVFVSLLFQGQAWAGLEEGFAAAERGDYASALNEFKPLAEHGDAEAQLELGVMYERGRGVPKDFKEALT